MNATKIITSHVLILHLKKHPSEGVIRGIAQIVIQRWVHLKLKEYDLNSRSLQDVETT